MRSSSAEWHRVHLENRLSRLAFGGQGHCRRLDSRLGAGHDLRPLYAIEICVTSDVRSSVAQKLPVVPFIHHRCICIDLQHEETIGDSSLA